MPFNAWSRNENDNGSTSVIAASVIDRTVLLCVVVEELPIFF